MHGPNPYGASNSSHLRPCHRPAEHDMRDQCDERLCIRQGLRQLLLVGHCDAALLQPAAACKGKEQRVAGISGEPCSPN